MDKTSKFKQLIQSINKSSTIVLIGFMGSGKTTMGKKLATKLNYNFLDTDKEIENLVGMSILSIFETKGETYFRTLEKQFIEKLDVHNTVIATGGGLPCFNENIDYLNKIGVTVYLKYSVEELFERLKSEINQRPILKDKSNEELMAFIEKLLNQRKESYEKAQRVF